MAKASYLLTLKSAHLLKLTDFWRYISRLLFEITSYDFIFFPLNEYNNNEVLLRKTTFFLNFVITYRYF